MSEVKYVEVKRKANVGEQVKVVAIHPKSAKVGIVNVGEVFTVKSVDRVGDIMHVEERDLRGILFAERDGINEYVVLEPVVSAAPTSNLLESLTQFLRDNADEVRKIIGDKPVKVADNNELTRAKVIAQAKADVEGFSKLHWDGSGARVYAAGGLLHDEEFVVNREKRTVVCLLRRHRTSILHRKGIAKCAPGEVFNADIGKAISLRRALGLTVPAEYLNAPQPDEPRVGADIEWGSGAERSYRVTKIDGQFYDFYNYDHESHVYEVPYENGIAEYCTIIDDTDVDYTDRTEVAA